MKTYNVAVINTQTFRTMIIVEESLDFQAALLAALVLARFFCKDHCDSYYMKGSVEASSIHSAQVAVDSGLWEYETVDIAS